ncbi:MAG: hypothetical protein JST54_13255 [Deltaproteobacteria bacterium]|nr:hypothetical protein [Deltaproteobacteria bacterium]
MTRQRLAIVGFLGHAPGLWLIARFKLDPVTARLNVAAALATVAAIVGAGFHAGGWAAFLAWVGGHFAWSGVLAYRLLHIASPSEKSTS